MCTCAKPRLFKCAQRNKKIQAGKHCHCTPSHIRVLLQDELRESYRSPSQMWNMALYCGNISWGLPLA
eukprot:CAMPEP_0204169254 /NCGR_PEP_ID=MMETSP0361-20130328/41389_1 /ASSEMBLY_ACC=CAM_ASM_000343 /TAXON_ID=268821 /ORGANISM="Scrippsiella Hangoei, Strain SHTV-5" /LENGTH=67 /DNA_ID=CAMNT_0051126809 /DNA_START=49 /DNA_END=248 /DNA_ORIENTATION=+